MPSGGARPNSGRKPMNLGREQMNIRVTPEEKRMILALVEALRKEPTK